MRNSSVSLLTEFRPFPLSVPLPPIARIDQPNALRFDIFQSPLVLLPPDSSCPCLHDLRVTHDLENPSLPHFSATRRAPAFSKRKAATLRSLPVRLADVYAEGARTSPYYVDRRHVFRELRPEVPSNPLLRLTVDRRSVAVRPRLPSDSLPCTTEARGIGAARGHFPADGIPITACPRTVALPSDACDRAPCYSIPSPASSATRGQPT